MPASVLFNFFVIDVGDILGGAGAVVGPGVAVGLGFALTLLAGLVHIGRGRFPLFVELSGCGGDGG